MEESSSSNNTMIKLTATNYSIWKSRMEDLLCCLDYEDTLLGDEGKPKEMADTDWTKLNRKAVGKIRQWVDNSVYQHVANETNASVVWKTLQELYENKNAQNKAFLFRKLMYLRYKDGTPVSDHLNTFQGIVNQLTGMDMKLEDEILALCLISSLPDSWKTLVVSLSNSAPSGKLTLKMVKESMLNEENRRTERGLATQSQVLVTEKRGRSKSRTPKSRDGNDRSRGKSQTRNDFKCYYCDKPGHKQSQCRLWKKEQKQKGEAKKEGANTAAAADGDVTIICDVNSVNLTCQDSHWVVDSGASYHVTSRRDVFSTYRDGEFGNVKMGNNAECKIVGIGDVYMNTDTGCKLRLKDVRHVPEIRLNLISTGTLDDMGYHSFFGEGNWKLTKGSLVVAKGKKFSSLYMTEAKSYGGEVNAVDDSSTQL